MVVEFPIKKVIDTATEYKQEADRYYVIKEVGTDDTAHQILVIDGKELGIFESALSPLKKVADNLLGPYDLRDEWLVIPPDKTFKTVGASGKKLVLIGNIVILAPAEAPVPAHMARFGVQHEAYRTHVEGAFTFAVDEAWAVNREVEVFTLTAGFGERYTFDDFLGVSFTNVTVGDGDVGVRFWYKGTPFDILRLEAPIAGRLGIDALQMPLPPADATNMIPFSLKDRPIVLNVGEELKITAINTSGADLTPPTGTAISITLKAKCKYQKPV